VQFTQARPFAGRKPPAAPDDDFAIGVGNVGLADAAIPAESFASAFAISQPEDVDVNEILFRPTRQELTHGGLVARLPSNL